MNLLIGGMVAALFAVLHLFGDRFRFESLPRSVWLSAAGGVSVAYVFVHLLPELAEHQHRFESGEGGGLLAGFESHVYLIALIGLSAFYGLERLVRRNRDGGQSEGEGVDADGDGTFWVHLGSFAVYNLLIGYLLVHREESELRELLIYAAAMALHFVVNDQGLRQHHGDIYHRRGRWILAAAPVAGWLLGLATEVPDLLLSALFAFLAGGVVLNVLKEELPEDRASRFWAFAVGAAAYSALLVVSA